MTQRKTTFSEEFAIIPKFMYLFAPVAFIGMFCAVYCLHATARSACAAVSGACAADRAD